MRKLFIGENDKDQRLDKFMQKTFKSMPRSMVYKYIRKKCVRINGFHASADSVLALGDELSFYISDEYFGKGEAEFLDLRPSFGVVYEDENILIVDKPAGLLCQPDGREKRNTLDNHIKSYLYSKGEYSPDNENSFSPALCNRIDKNTQGLVISAKNADSLRIMNEKIKKREIEKYYLCLVYGKPSFEKKILHDYLIKDYNNNSVRISSVPAKGYKEIKTEYEVLATDNNISLLRVRLLTGRTHQIRAHMAYIGHPLLGDGKYGKKDKKIPFMYQALSSCELFFDFKTDAGALSYLDGKRFKTEPFFAKYDIVTNLLKIQKTKKIREK